MRVWGHSAGAHTAERPSTASEALKRLVRSPHMTCGIPSAVQRSIVRWETSMCSASWERVIQRSGQSGVNDA
jgi:hypothetical protein